MALIPNELIDQLTNVQSQILQTASTIVSEAANQTITLSNPLTVATAADICAEIGEVMTVIQFAFASQPENIQVILLPQDLTASMAELVQGSTVEEVDENTVAVLRTVFEGLVQGICLGVGNLNNDMIVATGLSIRFQTFAFPPNLQRADRLIRSQVAVSGQELNGSAIWLMDVQAASTITGNNTELEEGSPFPAMDDSGESSSATGSSGQPSEEGSSLDRLIDVPLEVSVELGRVRMLVREILDLTNGSILEINKAAGEPVDVLVNGQLVAKGEVVVIEDNFGVRITEIVTAKNRHGREAA